MSEGAIWRVLYVEDDEVLGRQVCEALELGDCGPLSVQLVDHFDNAQEAVESRRFDLLILDVFSGRPSLENERAGVAVMDHLQRVRFTPTIFYTALPAAVEGPPSPFVKVIGKEGSGLGPLLEAVRTFVSSGLLALNRGLTSHVEMTQLDYMKGFVAEHWETFSALPDKRSLAYLLARRLAASLSRNRIDILAQALGERRGPNVLEQTDAKHDVVHRMHYYIMPPVSTDFITGDIVENTVDERKRYRVVLTPSCDLVTGRGVVKAEYVLLACCEPLEDFPEYREWHTDPSHSKKGKTLKELLKNNRKGDGIQPDRYHYLPGVFDLPHLVVDFQKVERVNFNDLLQLKRVASLDSPYTEALLSRYNRYLARLGTPDLDLDDILANLQPSQGNQAQTSDT